MKQHMVILIEKNAPGRPYHEATFVNPDKDAVKGEIVDHLFDTASQEYIESVIEWLVTENPSQAFELENDVWFYAEVDITAPKKLGL